MTDSGGMQKEAFFFQKPCVTLRDETEWIELVENGFNKICGADPEKIYSSYLEMINKSLNFNQNFYGDGNASEIIIQNLLKKI